MNVFLARSEVLVGDLPESLRPGVSQFLKVIKLKPSNYPKDLIFLPIIHPGPRQPELERDFKKEFRVILNSEIRQGDLLVSGENSMKSLRKPDLEKEIIELFNDTVKSGYVNAKNPRALADWRQVVRINAFEEELARFLQVKGGVHAIGTDSRDVTILLLAFERGLNILGDFDGSLTNEIKHRIGIEGRTRYSLNRACNFVKPGQRVVFVQGTMHKDGVEQWCLRNNVRFDIKVPPSIASRII